MSSDLESGGMLFFVHSANNLIDPVRRHGAPSSQMETRYCRSPALK